MLVFFVIAILIVILLIVFAAAGSAQPARTLSRSEPPHVASPLIPEPKPRPHIKPQPKFKPRKPQALEDVFVPVAKSEKAEQPFRFSEAKIEEALTDRPVITGRVSFNWDAQCPLTGQIHRVCSCNNCKNLRSQNGVS
jgi:hypothetical protein